MLLSSTAPGSKPYPAPSRCLQPGEPFEDTFPGLGCLQEHSTTSALEMADRYHLPWSPHFTRTILVSLQEELGVPCSATWASKQDYLCLVSPPHLPETVRERAFLGSKVLKPLGHCFLNIMYIKKHLGDLLKMWLWFRRCGVEPDSLYFLKAPNQGWPCTTLQHQGSRCQNHLGYRFLDPSDTERSDQITGEE